MEVFGLLVLLLMGSLFYKKRTGASFVDWVLASFDASQKDKLGVAFRSAVLVSLVVTLSLYYECSLFSIFLKLTMLPVFYFAFKVLELYKNSVKKTNSFSSLDIFHTVVHSIIFVNFLLVFMWKPGVTEKSIVVAWVIIVPIMTILDLRKCQRASEN